jgi:hypothetical protein
MSMGDARTQSDPVPPRPTTNAQRTTTPTGNVQRAVVRPTPPAALAEATHQPITRPQAPVKAPVQSTPTTRVTSAIPTTTVQRVPNHTPTTQATKTTQTTQTTADRNAPVPPDRADLDALARRLLEPVGRLLRAELRHGRERAGLLHDRRR